MTKTQQKIFCPSCKTVEMKESSMYIVGSTVQCPKCGLEVYVKDINTGKFNLADHFFCDSDKQKIRPSCQDVKCANFAQCRPGFVAHRMNNLR
jgi:hypothetical protein